jgi:CBS domain-containing protein
LTGIKETPGPAQYRRLTPALTDSENSMLSVAEIMTREPYTLGPEHTLADARRLMNAHHIRHIPVISGDRTVIGLVSQRDVLAASDSSLDGKEGDHAGVPLAEVMTSPVQTVDEHASLRGAALHMHKHRMGCLPVTRDGALVGIITDSDFVAIAVHLMEQLEMVEPEEADAATEDFEELEEDF